MMNYQMDENSGSGICVRIAGDCLSASVKIPDLHDSEDRLGKEEILTSLKDAGVCHGIKEDAIVGLINNGPFDKFVEVAVGDLPLAGKDAQLAYMFDVAPDHSPKIEESGKIDYHEVNFLQGIKEGRVLIKRTPPTGGIPGKGVDGRAVEAKPGRNRTLENGTNTRISDDGLKLLATASGAIVFTRGNKVSVRDLITIAEDVDFSTGNVRSPGSVRVKGDVHAGFKVHAVGDIEIDGGVSDSEIISEGNVLIKLGFTGRGEGLVKADGNVTVQHVENQRVIAGHDIKIGGDSLHAKLEAGNKIILNSDKGSIHGGESTAKMEIRAAKLGSDVWIATTLRVGDETEFKEELKRIAEEIRRLGEDIDRVKAEAGKLKRLELNSQLSDRNKDDLEKLSNLLGEIPESIDTLQKDESSIISELEKMQETRIIATKTLYQGVKAHFDQVCLNVKDKRGPTELSCSSGRVVMADYDPFDHRA